MSANTGKTKTLLIDTMLFGISNFGSKILVFLLTPLYTSVLLTSEYGIADIINTTINFIYPILTLSIAEATLRFAMDKEVSPKTVLNNSILIIAFSFILLLCCYPLFGLVDEAIKTYWWVFVITFLLFNIDNCFSNFIKSIGKTKLFAIRGILYTVVLIISNILFLLFFKWGLTGYLLSIVVAYTVSVFFVFFCGKIYKYLFPIKPDFGLLKQMLTYSIPMIPTLLAWAINTSIDKYMITGFIGLGATGIYSVAHKIPTLLTTVVNIFLQAWQLSAISNYKSEDEAEYYTKVFSVLNLVGFIACIGIIPLSKWFSSMLFAEDYFIAWQCVPMLTISSFFASLNGFLAAAFRAYKKTKGLFVSVGIGAIVSIIMNIILINTIGVVGAAIGNLTSFAVTFIIRMVLIQKLVKIELRTFTTVLSYLLLLIGAFLITFDVTFATVIFVIIGIVILLLHLSEIRDILNFGIRFFMNIKNKKIKN